MLRRKRREEGQIVLPLLLFVVCMLFFGLVFFQVGDAGDQKTQTQTAADAAAVSAAHIVRDAGITRTALTSPSLLSGLFAGITGPFQSPQTAACLAAQSDWHPSAHRDQGLSCGDLSLSFQFNEVTSTLTGPANVLGNNPVPVADQRFQATSTARIVAARCEIGLTVRNAVINWMLDNVLVDLGAAPRPCLDAAQIALLKSQNPVTISAAVGDPITLLTQVRNDFRTEIVE